MRVVSIVSSQGRLSVKRKSGRCGRRPSNAQQNIMGLCFARAQALNGGPPSSPAPKISHNAGIMQHFWGRPCRGCIRRAVRPASGAGLAPRSCGLCVFHAPPKISRVSQRPRLRAILRWPPPPTCTACYHHYSAHHIFFRWGLRRAVQEGLNPRHIFCYCTGGPPCPRLSPPATTPKSGCAGLLPSH